MPELAQAFHTPPSAPGSSTRSRWGEDGSWLAVMLGVTAVEACWWALIWSLGAAPAPHLLTYLVLAFAGLGGALLLRLLLQPRGARPNWSATLCGTLMVGLGGSLFLPLKYAIPKLVPFWLDAPLARAEKAVFAAEPWLLLDRTIGWATMPLDRLYGTWLPTQALVLFLVLLQPPSALKSRLLIAYVLAWFVLGVVAALVFSSAGPIFYDRLFGGDTFAPLRATLHGRGAWVVLAESDRMWASLASSRPGIVAGISAVPSIHVAISVWMIIAARTLAPKAAPFAVAYAALIWIGSVLLGWHYVIDGLAGALGLLALWPVSGALERKATAALIAG